MIEAKDLRIGNYVFSTETQSIQTIKGVTEEHPFLDTITFDYPNFDEINPIPLTEEWLIKFGFEYADSKYYDKPPVLTIQITNNETLDYEDGEFFIASINSNYLFGVDWNQPKYVHELQNLYFALTKTELKLKQ